MEQIKITLNGIEMTGDKGETILNIAKKNGVDIPNLCYNETLKIYGACSLCVVEIEGMPKLARACATTAADGMVITSESERCRAARKVALELLMSDHVGDCKGPCALTCPAHTNVHGYIKQIALGNDREAVRIIKEKIPVPASIGRVCPHPCEEKCRRQFVEEPLSIAFMKAFAADNDMASANPYVPEKAAATGKKIAVIGGGPAGLSAAYYLTLNGHEATVFEMMPEMGGMLRYGIPEYRLPKKVLAAEIKQIEDIGVIFKNNVKIGKDIAFADLKAQYDAVIVTIGCWKGTSVGCPGEDLEGVLSGIDVLRWVTSGEPSRLGKKVAVVGGGNVAMDACRTAVRCGADKVYVVYRRTRAEAPADDLEITEAIEEGVEFKFLTNPAEIIGENGHVKAMKLQIMELGEPDESGRRKPVPVEGKFEILDVDTVIAAIGQACNPEGLEGLELTRKNTIVANTNNALTNLEGVFAAGDATNRGASIAIEAIAEGDLAAKACHAYLLGLDLNFPEPYYSEKTVTEEDFKDRERIARAKMPVLDPAVRRQNFDSVILGFSEEAARKEAQRCLECGCHDFEECRLIHYANSMPIDPKRLAGEMHPHFTEQRLVVIERDQGKCILCNQCVRTCAENAKKGILGLVDRGFKTVIKPEFNNPATIEVCKDCMLCAEACPTGALKILK